MYDVNFSHNFVHDFLDFMRVHTTVVNCFVIIGWIDYTT